MTDETVLDHIMVHLRKQARTTHNCPKRGCEKAKAPPEARLRIAEHFAYRHFGKLGMRCPAKCGSEEFSRVDARKRHRRTTCCVCAGCEHKLNTPKERHMQEMESCGMVDERLRGVLLGIWESRKERGVEDEAKTEEQPSKRRKTH